MRHNYLIVSFLDPNLSIFFHWQPKKLLEGKLFFQPLLSS